MHKWILFVIAALFFLFEFVARVEPGLAALQIADHFSLTKSGFGTLASVFFWIYAPMQLLVGLLLDSHGPRRFVVPAILVCAVGVGLFTLAPNPAIAGVGRFATGLGASFAFVGALYVVNHWFPARQFAVLSGAVNAIGMLGTAIGAVALTSLIETQGWQVVFLSTSVAGIAIFAAALFLFKDHSSHSQAIGTVDKFIDPLKEIVRSPRLWLIAVMGALYYMPVNVFGGLWGQAELVKDHGLSPVQAETAVSMIFWGMAVGSVAAGFLSDWWQHRKWIVISNAALAALAYSLAIFTADGSLWFIASMLFLGGLFGGAQMLTFAMAKEGHAIAISGTIIAFVNMIGIGGALVFQPAIGLMIDQADGDFHTAMMTIPACLIIATILGLFISEERHEDHR